MHRHGSLFADHFHSHLLLTPSEVVTALGYVLGNYAHHFGGGPPVDPFSSGAYASAAPRRILAVPVSWLLTVGWRRAPRKPALAWDARRSEAAPAQLAEQILVE
jgi:hypothetical protein